MNRKHLFFLAFSLPVCLISFGQKTFTVNNSSKIYTAKIQVAKCEDENCSGKGIVKLFSKKDGKLNQLFTSADLNFVLDKTKNPSTRMELYDEQSP